MNRIPTLQQVLQGYRLFNEWELEEQARELPRLTVEESLTQYFDLCDLGRKLAPDWERIFLNEDMEHWIAVRRKMRLAAKVMGNAKTARRGARGGRVSHSA
ncbi:MAG TPA: hypothetical protein VJ793_17635 [Anaerolineae bacterium]|nr:hypothetical protein [Anaerolineae bacterium]